jgi:alpha-beta hydrolase superfamily lysophospholipase
MPLRESGTGACETLHGVQLDYPGHGYSDIPKPRYDAAFFTEAVEGFISKLNLRGVTLAGVSIGEAIALIIAAQRNPRVARVIAINPYDYAKGRGMARSSIFGWFVTYASERGHDRTLIPNGQMTTLARGEHFLSLDRPQELHDLIVRFAAA